MKDEPQHTTAEPGATDRPTDTVQTEPETADDARLDEVEQRVEDHQTIPDGLQENLGSDRDGIGSVTTRWGVLTAGGLLGPLGFGAGSASADGAVQGPTDSVARAQTSDSSGWQPDGTHGRSRVCNSRLHRRNRRPGGVR
jgi:hypothetical protein